VQTKLKRPLSGEHVHFVAIGGVGMAALAELLISMGYTVSGSDLKQSRTVARLLTMGADVKIGPHNASYVNGADHVVFSNAVRDDNPEVARGRDTGAEVLSRAQLLSRLVDAGRGVAVTGTHGKTTTSSMVARALDRAGFEPSFIIGGDLNDVGSGAALGSSDIVVAEADEAFGSFLEIHPEIAVVTNIDRDHLEHYKDQPEIDDAFVAFLAGRRPDGWAVLCADDPGVQRVRDRVDGRVATYGTADADLVLDHGTVTWRGRPLGGLELAVPGVHNLLNAAAALVTSLLLDADPEAVLDALRRFGGVDRRFSIRGESGGVTVVDDYAHNPRKVAVTLAAARDAYPGRRIVALFQPHLYSRTLHLADEFGTAFDDADLVVVTDVYGQREDPIPGVSGLLVSEAVRGRGRAGMTTIYLPRLEEAAGFVAGIAQPGDVVITMGAGDVTTAAPRILRLLGERE
jgi:UDP-N-acetylmuramate--alanine ligase